MAKIYVLSKLWFFVVLFWGNVVSTNDLVSFEDDIFESIFSVLNVQSLIRNKRGVTNTKNDLNAGQDLDSDYANENITANSPDTNKLTNPVECVNTAFEDFRRRVTKMAPELTNMTVSLRLKPSKTFKNANLFDNYEVKSFEKFCRIYGSLPQRLEMCPKSSTLTLAKHIFKIFNFFCKDKYSDFKKLLPCFQKHNELISKACDAKCVDNSTSHWVEQKFTKKNSTEIDVREMKKILKEDCEYIKCEIDCKSPVVKTQCGIEATNLIKEAVRAIFSALIEITKMTKIEDIWDKPCLDLANYK